MIHPTPAVAGGHDSSQNRGTRTRGRLRAGAVSFTVLAAMAVATPSWASVSAPAPGSLSAVAAISSSDVWAVGSTGALVPMAEHWNGTAWSAVPVPAPAGTFDSFLTAVTAVSVTDIWAAGYSHLNSGAYDTLVEHYNGHTWSIVASPNPGGSGSSLLFAISSNRSGNVWAVGDYSYSGHNVSLIEHWTGKKWIQTASPQPNRATQISQFYGVATVSAKDAWAIGRYTSTKPFVAHWNGTSWKQVASAPEHGAPFINLYAAGADSATDVWAVGNIGAASGVSAYAEHWNGTSWSPVPVPGPAGTDDTLEGVSADSPSDAWAVGVSESMTAPTSAALIEHWNGKTWRVVPSPDPSGSTIVGLGAVSALSPATVWAAGNYVSSTKVQYPVAEHWVNGHWELTRLG